MRDQQQELTTRDGSRLEASRVSMQPRMHRDADLAPRFSVLCRQTDRLCCQEPRTAAAREPVLAAACTPAALTHPCPCRLSVINLSRGMSIQMSTGTVHMYVRAPYNRSTIDGRP